MFADFQSFLVFPVFANFIAKSVVSDSGGCCGHFTWKTVKHWLPLFGFSGSYSGTRSENVYGHSS